MRNLVLILLMFSLLLAGCNANPQPTRGEVTVFLVFIRLSLVTFVPGTIVTTGNSGALAALQSASQPPCRMLVAASPAARGTLQ